MIDQIIAAIGEDNIESTAEVEKVRRDYNKSIKMVSDSLTGLTDAFYDILASHTNVVNINSAVLKARESQSRENMLESGALASIVTQPVSPETTFNFDDLTSAINDLNAAIDQYGLGNGSGGGGGDDDSGGIGDTLRKIPKGVGNVVRGTLGVGALAGLGYVGSQAKASPSLNREISGSSGRPILIGGFDPSQPPTVTGGSNTGGGFEPSQPLTGSGGFGVGGGASVPGMPAPDGITQYHPNPVVIGDEVRSGGTPSWRLNNPGNVGYSAIARRYGAIGTWKNLKGDPQQRTTGIAIMPSLQAGMALKAALWRAPSYRNLTLRQGVNRWVTGKALPLASRLDGYAADMARAAGVPVNTAVNNMSNSQLARAFEQQKKWEGFRVGRVEAATAADRQRVVTPPLGSTGADGRDRSGSEGGTRLQGSGQFIVPLSKPATTSSFGMRMHPILKVRKFHGGIDYGANEGTPVYASADGVVTWAKTMGTYGKLIKIQHDGPLRGYETRYAHLTDRISGGIMVREGQRVTQGQQIGKVGTTGRSTGPHLHFELLRGSNKIDPASLLSRADSAIVPDPNPPASQEPRSSSQVADQAAQTAIQKKTQEEAEKPPAMPIIIGGPPQNPADYLGAVKPKRDAKPQGRNPAREYKLYFAA